VVGVVKPWGLFTVQHREVLNNGSVDDLPAKKTE
jgi:hypothetical protein